MSFVRTYHALFTVAVEDDASKEPLAGIAFAPTAACRSKLTDHQLVFRPRPTGFQVFYQANPEAPDGLVGRVDDRVRLSFAMMLTEAGLFARYKPDLTAQKGPQLYLNNLTPSGNIQTKNTLSAGTSVQEADAARLAPPVFQVPIDLDGDTPPSVIRVRAKFDAETVLREVPIAAEGARTLTTIDLSGLPSGAYTLETDADPTTRTVYVDRALAASAVLGVVDLYRETPQDAAPAGGVSYFIRFQRR